MDKAIFETAHLAVLNDQQRAAVEAVNGPVLLLAVPGSGKTTVLITRLGYMTEVCGIAPEAILTMTYTVAATQEMRARFAARFGFAIDPPTGQAARALCAHLDCVSVERIEEELSKLLAAPAPAAYLDEKILKVIIPELSAPALQAAKPVVDACPAGTEDLPVRWAALLMSLGEDGTRKALKRLRCSNACIEQTAVLVRETGGGGGSFLLGHEKGHSIALPKSRRHKGPPPPAGHWGK